jgi:predicted ArsR family transcriptional regulator
MESRPLPPAHSADRRADLMAALLQEKAGLTIEQLVEKLGVTRTAVRQHLAALERDGEVARAGVRPTGGRPQHVYVLTESGSERFTRRYSWFADLLMGLLRAEVGEDELRRRLESLGESAAGALLRKASADPRLSTRLAELAAAMRELGYETDPVNPREKDVVARNCIFHQLAVAHPEICAFDLGLMATFAGAKVDHVECMARGQHVCRFRFGGK